jgi:hypothetical protein
VKRGRAFFALDKAEAIVALGALDLRLKQMSEMESRLGSAAEFELLRELTETMRDRLKARLGSDQ